MSFIKAPTAVQPRRPGVGRNYRELQAQAMPTINARTMAAHLKRLRRRERNLATRHSQR